MRLGLPSLSGFLLLQRIQLTTRLWLSWEILEEVRRKVQNSSFILASVLKNPQLFQQFLVRNLSLSNSTASVLLNSPVGLQEVYGLIFGTSLRDSGGANSWSHVPKSISQKPADKVLQVKVSSHAHLHAQLGSPASEH
ncbi:hypothetical protein CHARACLAT_032026 [Characodon lateralis]|uniref:Uncharacterized protein n=1 Tax=Characodon lateralis TaxID=208331 RepID=A0ABU7CVB1_9TELE|nr:hypothetical protein [Characodon lateralis]